jgi:hypothetical protein
MNAFRDELAHALFHGVQFLSFIEDL